MRLAAAIRTWFECMPQESWVDRALRVLTTLIVVLFPAACLLVDRSDSLSLLLMLAMGLWVWVRNGFRSGLTRSDWRFVAAFAAYFFVAVLAFQLGHQTDEGFRLLGRYLRLLFVLPVLLTLRRYRPAAATVWTGLGLGALVLGVDAVWESIHASGFLRPDGDTNVAILFGDLATVTTFAFAAGYIYIDGRLPRIGPYLVAGCVLLGLMASFLSGTRGAWIAIPVLLLLFLSCRHLLRPRTVLTGAAAVVALFAVLALLPASHTLGRVRSMISELGSYRALNRDGGGQHGKTGCLDDPGALRAWISYATGKPFPGFTIAVDRAQAADVSALAADGCSSGYVVRLVNPSNDTAWLELPRYRSSEVGTTSTLLLVKGIGHAGFSPDRNSDRPIFYSPVFAQLALTTAAHDGYSVALAVEPHDSLDVVPVESYLGEYRYALLQTPIGQRLDMWLAALKLFARAPLLGVGTGAYQVETQRLVAEGRAAHDTADFDHPHSDYLDVLSGRGLLGLAALLLLLGVPAWLYLRRVDSHDPHCMGAALGGLLVSVGFAVFGLTETMFIHSVTIGWYVIMTAVFLVSSDAPQGQDMGTR